MTLDAFRKAEEEEGYRCELGEGVVAATDVHEPIRRRAVGNLDRAIAVPTACGRMQYPLDKCPSSANTVLVT